MDPHLDDNQALNSSDSAETLDVSVDTGSSQPSTEAATSSGATDAQAAEKDTLSVVRDVVEASKTEAEASSAKEGEEAAQDAADTATKKEPDNEDYSDVPFNKHPRFQQLLRDSKANKLDAGRYRNIQGYLDQQGISAEEAAEGFIIMGLMKHDPAEAWKRLQPKVQQLLQAAGELLPSDLAERVQRGEMTREVAFEVSRSRAHVQAIDARQSFAQQQEARRQQEQRLQGLVDTANSWEADRRRKDPNFDAKFEPLQKELAYIQMREGKPDTNEGVRDQLERAYRNVVPPAPAVQPRPRPAIRAVASTGSSVSGNAQPAMTSTLDIIKAQVAKR